MPPRPFPYAFRVGADVCHIPRIRRIITKPALPNRSTYYHLDKFLGKVLTEREQKSFWVRFHSARNALGPNLGGASSYLAGRWAAKEAIIKAVKPRILTPHEIIILHESMSIQNSDREVYAIVLDRPDLSLIDELSGRAEQADKSSSNEEEHKEGSSGELKPTDKPSSNEKTLLTQKWDKSGGETSKPLDLLDGQIVKLSISHDGEYAFAVCIAPEMPRLSDAGGKAAARNGEIL